MHWLTEWMQTQQISRRQFANALHVSERLIDILIDTPYGITHPKIADAIADFTGATAEQRDMLVHKRHRGKYVPGQHRQESPVKRRPPVPFRRAVVQLNHIGEIIGEFPSIKDASEATGRTKTWINNRCLRKVQPIISDFKLHGYTFRDAAEWRGMSKEERQADMSKVTVKAKRNSNRSTIKRTK